VDGVSFTVEANEKVRASRRIRLRQNRHGAVVAAPRAGRAGVSGEVVFDGVDVAAMAETPLRELRGRDIAMIFQEPMTALNPIYSVGWQIVEAIQLHEKLSKVESGAPRGRVIAAHRRARAPKRRFSQLPAPIVRRPAPARDDRDGARLPSQAADCRTSPRRALDVTIQAQILDLLAELQGEFGMAVILITHDSESRQAFRRRASASCRAAGSSRPAPPRRSSVRRSTSTRACCSRAARSASRCRSPIIRPACSKPGQ